MNNYKVKKAKLIDRLFLEVELIETVNSEDGEEKPVINEMTKKCRQQVHADLIAAFDALIPHLPHLCELASGHQLRPSDDPENTSYKVTGFSIGGEDEHEGVTLIGRKNLSTQKVLNLCAPFTKWEDEHNGYLHAQDLNAAIASAEYEILQYVFHGKKAPAAQLEMDLAS